MHIKRQIHYLLLPLLSLVLGCTQKNTSEITVYYNGTFHSPNAINLSYIEVTDGKITGMGNWEDYPDKEKVQTVDLQGGHVYPGFIDAHCHFYHYGLGLSELNLKGTKSYEEVIQKVIAHAKKHPHGWIEGRGWDHTAWEVKEYPDKAILDSLFPNRPVLLKRIDGHAALANNAALAKANISLQTQIPGGEILKIDGQLTGILIDNAVDSVFHVIPMPTRAQQIQGLMQAQKNCFEVGLTTVVCAGLDIDVVMLMDSLHKTGDLKMKVYAMLNPNKKNFDWAISQNGKPYKTDYLHVRSFKLYADGSLGSRGALLKEAYCDKKAHFGLPVLSYTQLDSFSKIIFDANYQVNTHCIGDSANSMMLNLYGKYLQGTNDKRWRIEHAQIIDLKDLDLFRKFSILPSVQPTHATSDMRWAEQRVCKHRMSGAYAYKKLLQTNGILPLGTDFPVEGISPLETYYAAVFRSKDNSTPFQLEDGLSPVEAIKGMTQWAAYSCFEEREKGDFALGYYADFVILNQDLAQTSQVNFGKIKVLKTIVKGEEVYR